MEKTVNKEERVDSCALCGRPFVRQRSDMRFCSARCRRKYHARQESRRLSASFSAEEARELWKKFREGEGFRALQKRLEEKRRKNLCAGCVWGMSGVCIRPACRRQELWQQPLPEGGDPWPIILG